MNTLLLLQAACKKSISEHGLFIIFKKGFGVLFEKVMMISEKQLRATYLVQDVLVKDLVS